MTGYLATRADGTPLNGIYIDPARGHITAHRDREYPDGLIAALVDFDNGEVGLCLRHAPGDLYALTVRDAEILGAALTEWAKRHTTTHHHHEEHK